MLFFFLRGIKKSVFLSFPNVSNQKDIPDYTMPNISQTLQVALGLKGKIHILYKLTELLGILPSET